MIIDAHCYVSVNLPKTLSPRQLITLMDACGVSQALIAPAEKYQCAFNREGNDYILREVEKYPYKFIGLATVNPLFEDKAIKEFKRAIKSGLCAVLINPGIQSFSLREGLLNLIVELADEWRVPVYLYLNNMADISMLANLAKANLVIAGEIESVEEISNVPENVLFETCAFSSPGHLEKAIGILGVKRFIFASGSPVLRLGDEIQKIKSVSLSPAQLELIFNKTIKGLLAQQKKYLDLMKSIPSRVNDKKYKGFR